MNWKKLKSSLVVIAAILGLNGVTIANTTQLADTIVHQPAEAIMKLVLQHLPEHDPSSFDSYSAIIQHHFLIRTNLNNKTDIATDPTDTTTNHINSYLFSTESLSYQKWLKPNLNQIENLSTKTEGKDVVIYKKLASDLIDNSVSKPILNLFSKTYLSPFSQLAFGNYAYNSIDSITISGDSLYKITFRPKTGKRFDGFTGTALISTKDFAVRQIIARTTQYNPQEQLLVINQSFEQVSGIWMQSGTNIKVYFNKRELNDQSGTKDDNLIAESSTNIYQQQINPSFSPTDFNNTSSQLKSDSAITVENQIQQTKLIRFVTEGKIPMGYFNIDYNRIFGYNIYEGLKLGIGGETNRLLSKFFTFGGYISYGLKDKSIRNGEWINFYPSRSSDLRIQLSYKDVNMELGEPEFLETKTLLNPESYRYLLIKNMYATKRYSTGLEYRPYKPFNYYLFGDISENHSPQNTPYLREHLFIPINLARAGIQLRYTPGIDLQMEDGRMKEMNIPKSDYYVTFIKGLTILNGEYHYIKTELKGKFNLPFSGLGLTTIVFRGGAMSQKAPVIEFFNGYGSFAGTFSLAAPYSFGTMQLNEFAAANYTAIHLRHDFSILLFPEKYKTRPAFIFAQNIGFGSLNDQEKKQYNLQDYRKGFYESGFEINNLLRMAYLSWGAGIYYRYGPYQLNSMHENFAYKFGFFFKL